EDKWRQNNLEGQKTKTSKSPQSQEQQEPVKAEKPKEQKEIPEEKEKKEIKKEILGKGKKVKNEETKQKPNTKTKTNDKNSKKIVKVLYKSSATPSRRIRNKQNAKKKKRDKVK